MAGLTACFPEAEDFSLGEVAVAEFTVTDISTDENRNTYVLTSTTQGAFEYKWELGNGEVHTGGPIDTAYYPDKGTYTVTLTVLSQGGYSTATRDIVVENDAATGMDVIVGGDMEDPGAWTFYELGVTPTNYAFEDGAVKFTNANPAQSNIGMWQAVELEGGRSYQFSALVSGEGMFNSWMEVLIMDTEPVEGQDPSTGVIAGLNTWTGCGVGPFSGNLTTLSCVGDGNAVIPNSGTYYLFIKVGSWDGSLGSGLTVDNIKLVAGATLTEGDNIVQGSTMDDAGAWTVSNVGLAPTDVNFVDGVLRFTNGTEPAQTNIGVWQAVTVQADIIYRFNADIVNPAPGGSWLEFYLGDAEPVEGNDYTEGRIYPGDTVTFTEGGTKYLMIKVGSWDNNLGPDGAAVDDVTLVELF